MNSLLEKPIQSEFVKSLLAWYKKNGRHDMPWRKTKDPYAVIISEFMLQQTTVATVTPYYHRFLKKFPTLRSLATGDLNDVLALWSGLGYYARARNLWSAMRSVHTDWNGKIPSDPAQLEQLPGIGPYTAGAIASFAFNKPASVLDGNIIRVLMRVLAIEDDPKLKAVQILLKKTSFDMATLVQKKQVGGPRDLNLALMDLGSTVCLPQNPKCGECPVAKLCLARHYGRQNEIPLKGEKLERPTVRRLHAVVAANGKWLMGQRLNKGLFGGLWEFIGSDVPAGVEPVPFLEEEVKKETGLSIRITEAIPAFEHQLSHRVFVVRAFRASLYPASTKSVPSKKGRQYERFRWVALTGLQRLGVSAITRKIIGISSNAV